MDLTESIAPRSDQLNADDLMAGPRTVTIADVKRGTSEQPVDIVTVEYGKGRPYKPSKSMRRVLVAAWGPDSDAYTGRRLTIYRDPKITFGKDEVGGIRISHLTDIEKPLKLALTVTRGKRTPYVVQPLQDGPHAAPKANPMADLVPAFDKAGINDNATRLAYCINVTGRDLSSAADLTPDEITKIITVLREDAEGGEQE